MSQLYAVMWLDNFSSNGEFVAYPPLKMSFSSCGSRARLGTEKLRAS